MLYAIKELWEFDNPRDEAKKKKITKEIERRTGLAYA